MSLSISSRSTGHSPLSSRKKPTRRGMAMALSDIKDYMNENQKSAIYMREAKALIETYEFIEATECLDEAISLTPHLATAYMSRATCHKNLHMYTEAYYDYSFMIKLEPGNASHYCARGLCLAKLKRMTLALDDFDMAIELEPISLHFYSRASVLTEAGQYDRAMKDFHRAIQEEKDNTSDFKLRCLHRRACAYFEMKKYHASMKDLMMVLMIDPTNATSRGMLGKVLKMMSELKKAEAQITQTILKEFDHGGHFAERGDIRFQMNDPIKLSEAIQDFDKAVKLLEDHNVKLLKTVTNRVHSQMKVKRRRALANISKMGSNERGEKDEDDHVAAEGTGDDVSSATGSLHDGTNPEHNSDQKSLNSAGQDRDIRMDDPIAKSQLRQAQIKDYLYRKLHGELLPGNDKAHAARFHAALSAGGGWQVPARVAALTGLVQQMTSNQHGGMHHHHPSGGQSVGSHSQITHGGRESFDGSIGAVSIPSLSHSVRFDGDGENKKDDGDGGSIDGSIGSQGSITVGSRSTARRGGVLYSDNDPNQPLFGQKNQTRQKLQMLVEAAMLESYEQLADVLFRRAQAKLLASGYDFGNNRESAMMHRLDHLNSPSADSTTVLSVGAMALAAVDEEQELNSAIENALVDAQRASELVPTDDEYLLLGASCHIRLGHFDAATAVLTEILSRSPNNEKARYLSAFSLRAAGKVKEAVDELTHIIEVAQIANTNRELDIYSSNFLVPLERVLETRGILRRLLHAHEDALKDLERAIDIEEHDARIYFLIGDSKSILGDYDPAVTFFNIAQSKGYANLYTLAVNRGMVLRLLNRSAAAVEDFLQAKSLMTTNKSGFGMGSSPLRPPLNDTSTQPPSSAISNKNNLVVSLPLGGHTREDHEVERIRLDVLRAMCVLDVKDYPTAKKLLLATLKLVDACKERLFATTPAAISKKMSMGHEIVVEEDDDEQETGQNRAYGVKNNPTNVVSLINPTSISPTGGLAQGSGSIMQQQLSTELSMELPTYDLLHYQDAYDGPGDAPRVLEMISPSKKTLLFQLEWILSYHLALTFYHMKKFPKAVKMLNRCLSNVIGDRMDGGGNGLRSYAPNEVHVGTCLFFKGVALSHMNRLHDALHSLTEASTTKWAQPPHIPKRLLVHEPTQAKLLHDHQHHQMLCNFALAKLYQRFQQHDRAIELFTLAMSSSSPSSSDPSPASPNKPLSVESSGTVNHDVNTNDTKEKIVNKKEEEYKAFVYFRRAWSHKAMESYELAGDDFESARLLQPYDPNFALEYKEISQCEYMEFMSEPDLVEPFPMLVILPGSI